MSCFSISQEICQQAFDQIVLTFYPWHIITNVPATKGTHRPPLPILSFMLPGDRNHCLTLYCGHLSSEEKGGGVNKVFWQTVNGAGVEIIVDAEHLHAS